MPRTGDSRKELGDDAQGAREELLERLVALRADDPLGAREVVAHKDDDGVLDGPRVRERAGDRGEPRERDDGEVLPFVARGVV